MFLLWSMHFGLSSHTAVIVDEVANWGSCKRGKHKGKNECRSIAQLLAIRRNIVQVYGCTAEKCVSAINITLKQQEF